MELSEKLKSLVMSMKKRFVTAQPNDVGFWSAIRLVDIQRQVETPEGIATLSIPADATLRFGNREVPARQVALVYGDYVPRNSDSYSYLAALVWAVKSEDGVQAVPLAYFFNRSQTASAWTPAPRTQMDPIVQNLVVNYLNHAAIGAPVRDGVDL